MESKWDATRKTDLALEILTNKLEGVVKGVDCGELDIGGRLLFPCAVNDGGEDFIGPETEDLGFLERKRVRAGREKGREHAR